MMSEPVFDGDDPTTIWTLLNDVVAFVKVRVAGVTPTWQAYTPAWTDGANNLNIGDGSLIGRWCRVGDLVIYQIVMTRAANSNIGGGQWILGLPMNAAAYQRVQGAGSLTGNGKNLPVTAVGVGAARIGLLIPDGRISNVTPGSWGTEVLAVGGTYQVV